MLNSFNKVLLEYNDAKSSKFADHPLGELVRKEIPDSIRRIIDKERYKVWGSVGQGNWSEIPWIAIFDILITKTAQSGYYPVFLFKEDMSGFYLSIAQGIIEVKKKHKRDYIEILRERAKYFRTQLDDIPVDFQIWKIDLSNGKALRNGTGYEAGSICAKFYQKGVSLGEGQIEEDISTILNIYNQLVFDESRMVLESDPEEDEVIFEGYEDLTKFRFHKKIERNHALTKKVKETQKYTCKVCEFNFEKIYGEIGEKFIEAHHLVPISNLGGIRIKLNVLNDFVVLCANCHRMIHKTDDPSDIESFKTLIKKGRDSNQKSS